MGEMPYDPQQPKIADRCPSCGARSLFIGAGGWLTCSVIGCKRPAFERAMEHHADLLAKANERAEGYEKALHSIANCAPLAARIALRDLARAALAAEQDKTKGGAAS